MRKLPIVWGIAVVIIFGGLTAYGFYFKKQRQPYLDLENTLEIAAQKYGDKFFVYDDAKKEEVKITFEEMKEEKLIEKLETSNGDKCEGYATVEMKNVAEYKAYIKCDKYTTKGYK